MVITFKPTVAAFFLLIVAAVVIGIMFLVWDSPAEEAEETAADQGYVLVIDAGHGGEDGGAVSVTGSSESAINLSIALKMQAIADFTATPCVMTRETEEIEYPAQAGTVAQRKVYDQNQRIELIESIPGAVLISIHQNKYTASQPPGPPGVLWAE